MNHFDHFIYFIILSRVRQMQHLWGSSLSNIWWFHPSLPGSLHLRPYSGPQPAELPVAPVGEGEEHQTWGEQEDVFPGSDVYRYLRCQCSLPAEEDHPGQFVFVWWKHHLFFALRLVKSTYCNHIVFPLGQWGACCTSFQSSWWFDHHDELQTGPAHHWLWTNCTLWWQQSRR